MVIPKIKAIIWSEEGILGVVVFIDK